MWSVEKRSIEGLRKEGFERVARGEGDGMEDVLVGAHWSVVEGMDYEGYVGVMSASDSCFSPCILHSRPCTIGNPSSLPPLPREIRLQIPASTLTDPQSQPVHPSPYLRYQSPSLRSQLSSA